MEESKEKNKIESENKTSIEISQTQFVNRYGVAIKKVKKIYIPEYTKKRDGVANIEPKVNEPFELIPRRIPRAAVIDSLQKLFSSVKIEEILKKADVDFSRPEFNHSKLDLHHFDDKLYDIYPNEYWIKKCTIEKGKMLKIPGIALFFDKTVRIGEWKKVLISEYDAVQETFSGNIEDSNKTPFKKQKIFILFDAENPFVYAKRIIDALNTREIAENKIKYNYLLSKIPKIDKLNDLPELRKTKILNLISNTKDLSLVENSIAEEIMKINNSYFLTLNKLMFNRLYYNRQTAELCVGNLKIKQDPVEEIALYAKERLPPYDYNDLSTKLNTKFLLCKKFIIDVINEIKENSNKMIEEMNLFKVNFTNTIKIDEFKKAEKNHFTAFKMKMEQEKIGEIKKVLKRISVKTEDDHFEIDFVVKKIQKKRKCVFEEDKRKERYVEVLMQEINKHKTISFIGLINSIVKDALYSLVCKSIVSFIMFFENLIPVTVEVKSANEVVNTYDPSYFKKIKNISQSKINLKIPNAFGRETDCPDRDLNTTFDIENYSLGGSYNRPPMFHLTIMYREGQFEYNYKIEDLISEVKRIFDDGLDKVQKIQQIVFDKETTQHLFYKLIHRHKPINISNINNQDQNEKFNQKEMEWIDEIYERLGTTLLLGKQPLDKYLTTFEPYKEYFNFNAEQYVKNYDEDKSDPNINNKIRDDIVKFQKIKDKFQKQIPETIQVSYFLVNCKEIRDSLIRLFDKIIELELGLLDKNAKELKTMINKSIDDIKKDITKTGKNIDEVVNIERFIEDVPGMLESTKLEIENCLFIYKILDDFHSKSSYGDIRSRLMLLNGPTSVLDTISSFKTMLAKSREKFAEELDDNQAKLREDMIVLDKNVKSLMNYDSLSTMSEAAQLARNLENNFVDFKEKVKIYNNREIYFGREQTDYSKLLEMYKEFEPFFQIWTNSDNFLNKKKIWLMEDFSNLKGEEVRTVNENVLRNIVMSIKKLKDKGLEKTFDKVIKIAEEMKRQTEEFKPISNLAVFLTTEGLTERHWSDLKNIGIDCISNREGLTLDKLVANMKAGNDGKISNEVINQAGIIADKASRENQISSKLEIIENKWKDVNFVTIPYRIPGMSTIGGWGDIYTILDEDVLEVQQLEVSQFKGPFLDVISEWSNALLTITNVLEEWKRFQQKWMQLQPIFDSNDIHKNIPGEAKKFMASDRFFRELIKSMKEKENQNVKTVATRKDLLENLIKNNLQLEDVERGLNDYIEKKKAIFPRFYFISNEDLIEILSQTKDLNKIKENLKKIFESIHYIDVKDEKVITKMLSNLKEEVGLKDHVVIYGKNVEVWMGELEQSMFVTVKICLDKAIRSYLNTKREKWIFDHCGQCIMHAQQVHWSSQVDNAIKNKSIDEYLVQTQERINLLVALIRGNLNRVDSITIGNMITLEVHNKEVVVSLIDNKIMEITSFEWIKQLRYYWENNDCYIRSIQTSFPYGYEYLGNTEILVITPLTDKCYLTLMGALKLNMGGAPSGPAGTGKTESTKDLAKAIAKQCIVYNCSEDTDFNIVAKFFKGLACCGAWICFDEFNRIHIEVLSVIASQLIILFGAKNDGLSKIIFEKSEIRILPTFCVFITMNPDYEGRTALPDNLNALFRPMAMMVPDYKLISEVYLYSSGYMDASDLAKKIVATFKLSSEQLSTQSHYDFGMRAVKSVLYAARKLKRSSVDTSENQLLLRSLQDVNVPKFLKEDIELFKYIIKDLFPGIERPKTDLDNLIDKIKQNCISFNLQPEESFIQKIIQLYDTIQVRHGLMIVGPTGGGKTSNYKMLQKSLSDLHDGVKFFKTETTIINPKSIRMEQLYCEKDLNTMEWINGIIPLVVQNINRENNSKVKYWIMFDGPVDTLWIENMNSVLDDSRKLCLSSSAIIVLNETITMMFEVEDLTFASPATVSRCGMVFMEPGAIGLMPHINSWMNKNIPPNLLKGNFDIIGKLKKLFNEFLENSINFTRKKIKEPCPTVNISLANSLLRILDCFLEKYREKEDNKVSEIDIEILFNCLPQIFIYAVVWSIGITTNEDGRNKFNVFIRETINQYNYPSEVKIPDDGSAYDFYFDLDKGAWIKWESMLSYPVIDSKALYTDIFVPTVDSVRYSSLIKMLIMNNKHLIATGPTGTGKTINIMDIIGKGVGDKYLSLVVNFSAQTSANQTQETIDSKLKKKTRVLFAPENNKQMIIFVDDLNMPKKEKYEAQPPIELLRQWLDHKGWYDLKDKERQFMNIINLIFVGAMGPPGGGRSFLTQRFMRHFNLITYTELVDSSIKSIFERKVSHFLMKFTDNVRDSINPIVISTLTLYRQIKSKLLPTPKNPHYLFNLRDMSKVLQGACSASFKHTTEKIDFIRLWIHEMTRAFGDRLISEEDRSWLKEILDLESKTNFNLELENIYNSGKKIIFCDFVSAGMDRPYIQVTNMPNFIKKVEEFLYEYNQESKGKPMNLVMFLDACDHVARICRILRSTQGHALLLGVGGSGRQSLARLATYINRYDLYQIEVIKGYSMSDFRKNIKECLKIAGINEKPISFIICDTQIFNELILEDLNNALNSGDVPEIYKAEDNEEIRQACRLECNRNKVPETWTNIFNIYLNRVRTNIHIIIAMSPIGEVFSTRLRMFPCLVNCCTIDWFTEWPDEALESVAADKITLYNLDLGDVFKGCVQTIKYMHKSVEKISVLYQSELRRYNYLTPTSFLEFLLLYKSILDSKRKESFDNISRYEMGLKVLAFASKEIEKIEKDIVIIKPKLEQTTIIVEKTLKDVEINKAIADKVSAEAEIERKTAEEMNIQCTALDKQAQETLSSTQKELEESINKVNEIKDNQLKTLAAIANPSKPMTKFMLLLLNFFCGDSWKKKVYLIPNTDFSKKEPEYNVLTAAKTELSMLSSSDFKQLFYRYTDEEERNNLKKKDIKKVHLSEEFLKDFTREEATKGCSDIVGCFDFIVAMIDFVHKSIDVVDPLKEKAAIFREKKKEADIKLKESEAKFKSANDAKMKLEKEYNENVKRKNDLAFEISECQTKLERAKSLIVLLSGEKKRWADSVEELKKNSLNLIGDCLFSAAMIAYSGAFTLKYRSDLATLWKSKLDEEKILRSPEICLRFIMEDKLQTRKWNLCSLPNDDLSIENGIIIFKTRKWPLMIDPQNQAASFIKKYGPEVRINSFLTVKMNDPKMVDQVISSVKFGNWILLDNVGISLDTSLEPVLLQQKIQRGQFFEIKIGDKTLPYNDDFKLFMITNLSNPHYSPETFAKITIINFAITLQGLEEQMLSELVKIEMPELEETKNKILEENFKSSEILKEIEDKILDSLSKNKDNIQEILKTSDLIDILTEAKIKAKEINEKLIESEKTSVEIQSKRENYRPSAKRSSILFFTLLDLSTIDPMYQYSLINFKKLYENTIRQLGPSDDINLRIKDINLKSTKDFYDFTTRSLFERDKLLFSFCLALKILMAEVGDSEISPVELRFLLAGAPGDSDLKLPPNPTNWISVNEWPNTYSQIYGMTKISDKLKDFETYFMKNHNQFKNFFESPKNEKTPLPEPWDKTLTEFQKLIVIKTIRGDKVTASINYFVERKIGKEFTEPPTFDLEKSFKDSSSSIPLLFILVTGSDPVNDFKSFAEMKGRKYEFVSLGKSMDKLALSKIEEMKAKGAWILLQNCHLAISFMPKLEEVIEQLQINTTIDSNFRLWLTSMSSPNFSINVLKNSIKITMEPPKGLKLNLLRQYNNIKDQDLEACSKPDLFKTFFFSMCFFHAIIQDRRKFGPIGWNVRYEFTNEDLIVSRKQLKNFLDEYDEIPYKVINYLGAEINYGGRVTDDKDQRLIRTILINFLTPDILNFDTYKFSSSGTYFCPPPGDRNSYLEYIYSLPTLTAPEVFGLHENAEITTAKNDAAVLLETVLGMQPRTSSGSGKSIETVIKEILSTVENSTPKVFDYEAIFLKYPTDYNESMNTVLIQEVIRYNTLLAIMRKHIKTLKKALSGRIVMSEEMEKISISLYNNQVPQLWIKFGFLSLKPLMSWLSDLKDRISFFQGWIDNGTPKAFCLPRFSFPQAFLTGTLQNYSRKYTYAIDLLSFEFKILDMLNPNNVREKPQDGCYVYGTYIEGARWNYTTHALDISKNRELYTDVPLINMIPVKNRVIPTKGIYQCPLYKVLTRQGTLSTTGHSTNFVLFVEMPSNDNETIWVKAGVAMFLALKS